MKVLWFTNTPSCYILGTNPYNGGGWISSLEEAITEIKEIELGISFILNNQPWKILGDNVTYYPIADKYRGSTINKVRAKFISANKKESALIKKLLKVVDDFKPDIIEVFGSEAFFGLISKYVDIPVLLHIQGILTPYANAYLPPFISEWSYYFSDKNPFNIIARKRSLKTFRRNAKRELKIIKSISNFAGRTIWDSRIISLYNSSAHYYECGEILRNAFYDTGQREIPEKLTIISTISSPLYKGMDLILKTAQILKDELNYEFEWKIYGNVTFNFVEHVVGIEHKDVNIIQCGVATPQELKNVILNSTVYVHPSYIDNSPNSLCEAQILGCPVVATNVGGVSSLIENERTGYLVPANDPYQLAFIIKELYTDVKKNRILGDAAKEVALKRHDKSKIVNNLISIYHQIITNNGTL